MLPTAYAIIAREQTAGKAYSMQAALKVQRCAQESEPLVAKTDTAVSRKRKKQRRGCQQEDTEKRKNRENRENRGHELRRQLEGLLTVTGTGVQQSQVVSTNSTGSANGQPGTQFWDKAFEQRQSYNRQQGVDEVHNSL